MRHYESVRCVRISTVVVSTSQRPVLWVPSVLGISFALTRPCLICKKHFGKRTDGIVQRRLCGRNVDRTPKARDGLVR